MNTNSNQRYSHLSTYFEAIILPEKQSHKGENGKLLIIGGSELFHAASAWSLEIASKIVDMVLYSSTEENNNLVKEAKKHFWNGVVVPRSDLESYIEEVDCVLIGPGMMRDAYTQSLTNSLLQKYSTKRWVVDAGALQMVDVSLLNKNMIITPHAQEFQRVFGMPAEESHVIEMSRAHNHVVILSKGIVDIVTDGNWTEKIEGGNEGMTKGGTGDVLAGLVGALYCKSEAFASAVTASALNKQAGDFLYQKVGPFFNASDLLQELPGVLRKNLLKENGR